MARLRAELALIPEARFVDVEHPVPDGLRVWRNPLPWAGCWSRFGAHGRRHGPGAAR